MSYDFVETLLYCSLALVGGKRVYLEEQIRSSQLLRKQDITPNAVLPA